MNKKKKIILTLDERRKQVLIIDTKFSRPIYDSAMRVRLFDGY